MRTWHLEMAFATAALSAVALASGEGLAGWIGAGAVLGTFAHMQVSDRLAEREAARAVQSVGCHRWGVRYLIGKEALWVAYFAVHQSWAALAGVGLFLGYPLWRRVWRARRPLETTDPLPSQEGQSSHARGTL